MPKAPLNAPSQEKRTTKEGRTPLAGATDDASASSTVERGLDDPYYKRRWHMEETWEVERVVDVDVRDVWSDARQQAGPMLRCRVKWQGWKSECDTWEPLWELLGPEAKHMALKALRLALRRSQRATRRREQRERCRKERRARRQRKQQAAEAVRELWAVAVALAHGAKLELPVDSAAISACTTGVTIRLEGLTPMRTVVASDAQLETLLRPQLVVLAAAKPEPPKPEGGAAERVKKAPNHGSRPTPPPPPPPPRTFNSRLVLLNGAAYASGGVGDGMDGSVDGWVGVRLPGLPRPESATMPLGVLAGLWPEATLPYEREPWMAELREMERARNEMERARNEMERARSAAAICAAPDSAEESAEDIEAIVQPIKGHVEAAGTQLARAAVPNPSVQLEDEDEEDEEDQEDEEDEDEEGEEDEDEKEGEEDDELTALWRAGSPPASSWAAQIFKRRLLTPDDNLRIVSARGAASAPLPVA